MAEVKWAETAVDDLARILEVIAFENERAAVRLGERIRSLGRFLADFPQSGRMVPDVMKPAYRELVIPPCRLIYTVDGKKVTIIHVIRTEQMFRIPDYLSEPEESYLALPFDPTLSALP
jgi:toxin ParE1/3/4